MMLDELRMQREAAQTSAALPASTPAPEAVVLTRVNNLQVYDELLSWIANGNFRRQLIDHLIDLAGPTIYILADRVFKTPFADRITAWLSFTGGHIDNPNRAFEKSEMYARVTEVGLAWCTAHNSDRAEIEKAFQRAFKKAYNRMNRTIYHLPRRRRKSPSRRWARPLHK